MTDKQTDLRDRIAAAIWAQYSDAEPSRTGLVMANPHAVADAVLAVLPPAADRADVLREAADIADETVPPDLPRDDRDQGRADAAADIRRWADHVEQEQRRLAAEAQQQPETGACLHPDGCDGECPCPPSCGCCTVTAAPDTETPPASPSNRRALVHNAISDALSAAGDRVPFSVRAAATRGALAEVDGWQAGDTETRP